jgi:hypothetical protein
MSFLPIPASHRQATVTGQPDQVALLGIRRADEKSKAVIDISQLCAI